jgi:hypothetical protein
MQKLDTKEGPKDVFGDTCIVLGIPARFTNPGTDEFELFPYGYPGKEIWEVKFGIYQAINEISQVIFFRHGDIRSGDFITLMPLPQLPLTGCWCISPCNHWLIYMRNARRALQFHIIDKRMVYWVAKQVQLNSETLKPMWTNRDVVNRHRRLVFWRSQLRKEDLLTIFEPLRPGVDICTTPCLFHAGFACSTIPEILRSM